MPEVRVLVLATNGAFPLTAEREVGKEWRGAMRIPIPVKVEGSGLRDLVARRQAGPDVPGMLFLADAPDGKWPGGGSDAIVFALAALDAWVREECGKPAIHDVILTGSAVLGASGFGSVDDVPLKQRRLEEVRGDHLVRYFQAPGERHREGAIAVTDPETLVRRALPILCDAYDVEPRARRWFERQVDLTWPPRWRRRVLQVGATTVGFVVAAALLVSLFVRIVDDRTWAACAGTPSRDCVAAYIQSGGRHHSEALELRERKVYQEQPYVSAPIRVSAWGINEGEARTKIESRAQCGKDEATAWEPGESRTVSADGVLLERSYTCAGTRTLVEEPYAP